jgi:peptidoglycan/xylan/chitin deacetylase (PgdA/CDA1 family)
MNGSHLPRKSIILTFDDGYVDHYMNVFPKLLNFGYSGTFFVISGKADREDPNYMSWQQIKEVVAAGMYVEAHTKTHADLRNRNLEFLVYEILGSIESVQAHTQSVSRMFSYPAGRYDDATLNVVHSTPIWRALTTAHGAYHTTDNRYMVERLRVSGNMSIIGLEHLLRTSSNRP